MVKPLVYLDTSVINFIFADDAPEKQEITLDFFDHFVRLDKYRTVISVYVLDEIQQTPDPAERARLEEIIMRYRIPVLPAEPEAEIGRLAGLYLEQGVLPPKKLYDALHVAFCTVSHIDYLVSWNFKHLANISRERRILTLNLTQGYTHPLRILTPSELTGDA